MTKHASFLDRLQIVMDGREKYPWANSIGLGRGTIDGITRTGSVPGGDALAVIGRCENARIDWLLDGRGTPYRIACVTEDIDAAELLQEHIADDQVQRITVITDGERIAIALDQAASFSAKDGKDESGQQRHRTVEYRELEVIVGNIGREALEVIRYQPAGRLHLVRTTSDVLKRVARGMVGSWRMLNAADAIVGSAVPLKHNDLFFQQFNQQDMFPASRDEAILLDHYRAMQPVDRSALNQVATTMAKYVAVSADVPETPGGEWGTGQKSG